MPQTQLRWPDLLKMAEWGVAPPRIVSAIETILTVTAPWLNRTCPTCHAKPGQFCRTLVAQGEESHERPRPHSTRNGD